MDTKTDDTRAHWSPDHGQPTLVEVFPGSHAIPLPPKQEPLGRAWLAKHGIDDAKVSTEHARLKLASALSVEDLGSKNGTWVNGRRVENAKLSDGDLLRVGRTLFVYRPEFRGARKPDANLFDDDTLGALVSPYGLREVRRALERLESRPVQSVLIIGDTGVGKENVARAIAERSGRARPFVAVNAAAIPKDLFESELFGHEAGSFSGASRARRGRMVEANGGTFFLDEAATLTAEHQPKLLRALQGSIQPVGGGEQKLDVLFVAATNEELENAIDEKTFRRDLYARFEVRIDVPSLGDRPEDLFAIARHLRPELELAAVDVEAAERLALHDWPENVRGLVRFFSSPAIAEVLPRLPKDVVLGTLGPLPRSGPPTDEEIDQAMKQTGGNQSAAARLLGYNRRALRERLAKRKP